MKQTNSSEVRLPKLTQDETDKLNSPVTSQQIEFVV